MTATAICAIVATASIAVGLGWYVWKIIQELRRG